MDNDFLVYLFYIILIIGFLSGMIIFIVKKFKKRTQKSKKGSEITYGNIGIFFDREDNVIIIPYVKDKFNVGRAIDTPVFLNTPYNASRLGQTVRYSMSLCKGGEPCSDNELMSRLNSRGWKEFSEGKRNISVHYQQGHGVVFNTTRRRVDGSYQFNFFGFEKVIANDISDKELGEVTLSLLQRCRC